MGAEGDTGPSGREFLVGEVDSEAPEEGCEGDLGFHHREVLADALVRAGAEGEVAVFGEGAGRVLRGNGRDGRRRGRASARRGVDFRALCIRYIRHE